jgi:hypothetical protein
MLSLLIMVMFVIVGCRIAGRLIGVTERTGWHRRHGHFGPGHWRQIPGDDAARAPAPSVAPPVETPLAALQRRFAAGELSMEQYEREVGRLYGVKNG